MSNEEFNEDGDLDVETALETLQRPLGLEEVRDEHEPNWELAPKVAYREPYPLTNRQLEDKLDAMNKRMMLLGVGVVGAILLSAAAGRVVLRLVQGQAQLVSNMRDLASYLHLDQGTDQRTAEVDEPEVPEPTRMAVRPNPSTQDDSKGIEPLVVSDPFEIGAPKTGHVDLPNARDAREPFRIEE